MGAVKNAVQRDQEDPSIMDLDPEKSLDSQRPPEDVSESDIDPAFKKYYHMLKVGLSVGAVKNSMLRDGVDPDTLDLDTANSFVGDTPSENEAALSTFIRNEVSTKRGGQGTMEQNDGAVKSDEVAKEEDPRAALMAMLSKRAPPAEEAQQPFEEAQQGPPKDDEELRKVDVDEENKRLRKELEELRKKLSSDERNDPGAALTEQVTPSSECDANQEAPAMQAEKLKMKSESATPAGDGGPMAIGAMAAAAALKKTKQAEGSNDDAVAKTPGDVTDKENVPIKEDPRFTKYFKMLKMVSSLTTNVLLLQFLFCLC